MGGVCTEPRHVAEAVVSRDDELVVITDLRSQKHGRGRPDGNVPIYVLLFVYVFFLYR